MASEIERPVLVAPPAARPPSVASEGLVATARAILAAAATRLINGRAFILLARNTLVSCFVFGFDIALLWALVRFVGMGKFVAVALAFVVANSIHYALCRIWIFRGTERGLAAGYVYFFVNTGVGLVITIVLFAAFMQLMGLHYIVARVVASVFAGLAVFLLNAVLNFKSL